MHLRGVIAFILISVVAASLAWAKDVVLFANEKIVSNYEDVLSTIQPGDVLHFSYKSYVVGPVLGTGGTTRIFSLADDPNKALRVPLRPLSRREMISFNEGYEALVKNHVPSVKIEEAFDDEFSVVERLNHFILFKDFVEAESPREGETTSFWQIRRRQQLPYQEMKANFAKFAESLFSFDHIGDLHSENLIYDFDRKEWRLMDWVLDHRYATTESPLEMLLENYGRISKLHFTANDARYQWLEEMANAGHEAIAARRKGSGVSNAIQCAKAHLGPL